MTESTPARAAGQPEADAEFFAHLRRMRQQDPVSYNPMTGIWEVFRYADAVRVMTDPDTFRSDLSELTPPQEDYDLFFRGNIAAMDQPRHRTMRQLVSKAFSARFVAGLEPKITAIAEQLLDGGDCRDAFDLAGGFAFRFPPLVIADILGAPGEDAPLFVEWADALHAGSGSLEGMIEASRHYRALNAYMSELIDSRRAAPREDLISKLVTAELDGRKLDDAEIIGFIGVLLLGGISTSAALITNIVLLFDRTPGGWAELRADRSLVPAAIEEAVRLRPSFTNSMRMTARETELGGLQIPEGEVVRLWLASANRDEAQFTDPDVFDFRRDPNRHVGFGQGAHYCIGAPLGRMEAGIAFNLLLDRFADLRVDHESGVKLLDPRSMLGAARLPVIASAG